MIEDFFKRIKVNKNTKLVEKNNDVSEVEIHIEGNIELFKEEAEKIRQGAKGLLEAGKAESLEDAIITFAVMIRGLKFKEIKKIETGKTIVVLKESALRETEITDGHSGMEI